MTDLAKLIRELRVLAEKATKGPWEHAEKDGATEDAVYNIVLGSLDCAICYPASEAVGSKYSHDMQYIAAANPQTILALLDALDRQSPIAPSDDEVVKRVLAAVRDEVGSRLCHWTGTKRVCTREGWASSVCLCEQAARAAITAVGGAP